jgi:hypothetical protein
MAEVYPRSDGHDEASGPDIHHEAFDDLGNDHDPAMTSKELDTNPQQKARLTVRNDEVPRKDEKFRVLVGERVQQLYGDEMLVAPALSKRVGRLGVAIIVEPPLHDVAEVAGSGTAIIGLKPAPPASVTSSGSAPSLNADPVIVPGLGEGEGLLNPGAIAGVDGLQVPASADVPNGAIADVAVVVPGKPPMLVSVVGFAIPVIGHVVMLPRAAPRGGIRLPKLG